MGKQILKCQNIVPNMSGSVQLVFLLQTKTLCGIKNIECPVLNTDVPTKVLSSWS